VKSASRRSKVDRIFISRPRVLDRTATARLSGLHAVPGEWRVRNDRRIESLDLERVLTARNVAAGDATEAERFQVANQVVVTGTWFAEGTNAGRLKVRDRRRDRLNRRNGAAWRVCFQSASSSSHVGAMLWKCVTSPCNTSRDQGGLVMIASAAP